MKIPVDILVVLCLIVGVAPMLLIGPILSVAVAASLQAPAPEFSLAIWHGFKPAINDELYCPGVRGGGLYRTASSVCLA